jgi:hypothetical protein
MESELSEPEQTGTCGPYVGTNETKSLPNRRNKTINGPGPYQNAFSETILGSARALPSHSRFLPQIYRCLSSLQSLCRSKSPYQIVQRVFLGSNLFAALAQFLQLWNIITEVKLVDD